MPAKPLFDLATAACVKNLKGLASIGDFLPYETVRHILLKIESAHQLRQIELNSPQVRGQTGEIWLKLIERDFPLECKSTAYKPQNPANWYRVWEKYKKDHDRAIQESEDKLKNALAGLRQDKEKNTSRIIERKGMPRSLKLAGGKKLYSGNRDAHSNALTFNGGSRTKTNNGASIMRRVRREVKEIATIHGSLSKSVRGPTTQPMLQKAPAAMVDEYRRASQPPYRSVDLSPEPPSALEEHVERATFISDSEEDFEDDDMFGDEMLQAPSKHTRKPIMLAPPTSPRKTLSRATSSVPQASTPATASSSSSSSSSHTAKKGPGGLLSNKFRGTTGKAARKTSPAGPPPSNKTAAPKPTPQSEAVKKSQQPARAEESSPPPPASEPIPAPAASSDCVPRKRKAVDIFMRRPNKRM